MALLSHLLMQISALMSCSPLQYPTSHAHGALNNSSQESHWQQAPGGLMASSPAKWPLGVGIALPGIVKAVVKGGQAKVFVVVAM